MNAVAKKLIATIMALILSVVMVVTISYAWMTLSDTPVAEGLQITIGGGNTILVAANRTEVVDGASYNYPGVFGGTLNFGKHSSYDYLDSITSLTPVSTADGIHWFIPETYDIYDEEVINGEAVVGQLKPFTEFQLDSDLSYANLTSPDDATKGNYVYLDFWVVSPGSDYTLRVSRGDENGGSFLLELMTPEGTDSDGDGVYESYSLVSTAGNVASSARIGFLVNPDFIMDDTMLYYQRSYTYSKNYTKLRGAYQNPGEGMLYSSGYRFTVYEPNGDMHPAGTNGTYSITSPIGWNGNNAFLADIRDNLTVQLTNSWVNTRTDGNIPINEIFNTYITPNLKNETRTLEEIKDAFYNEYLQGHMVPYVNKGSFVQRTNNLYNYTSGDGIVTAEEIDTLNKAGATDDSFIVELEKNVPQRIRMFIWIEGQDIDCVGDVASLDFVLSIELAGSNQNVNEEEQEQD